MILALVTLSLLGDVLPGPVARQPARPQQPQCLADGDCVLSTFQGCCGSCCAVTPHAVPRSVEEGRVCASVDCKQPDCSAVRCAAAPDPTQFVAACRASRCVAVTKAQAAPQCRTNSDCRVVTMGPPAGASCHRSPCGCCPVTQAIPADGVVPLQKKPAPAGKPDFGLSTGGAPPPQAPNCSPCPIPAGGTALCQSGRCVLVDVPPRPPPAG